MGTETKGKKPAHSQVTPAAGKAAGRDSLTRGLHLVALFEGAKGVLVLIVGFGLLEFIHKDLHLAAEQLVRHFHLNPASHYPRIFIDASNHLTDGKLWALAFSAMLYSTVRFAEAVGLWLHRQWAEWFGVLTGGMYIPLELFELIKGITWPKATILIVNIGIVVYLAFALFQSGRFSAHNRRYSSNTRAG